MKTNPHDYAYPGEFPGFTKREAMAMHILAGINARGIVPVSDLRKAADRAVASADALIDALNEDAK